MHTIRHVEGLGTSGRISLTRLFAWLFLILSLMLLSNLVLAGRLHDTLMELMATVNEGGKIRFMSQTLLLRVTLWARNDQVDGEGIRALLHGTEAQIGLVESGVRRMQAFPIVADLGEEESLAALRQSWEDCRHGVEALLAHTSRTERLSFLPPVEECADRLLRRSDALVALLADRDLTFHRRIDGIILVAFLGEAAFLIGLFFFIRGGLFQPVRELAEVAIRFGSGDYSARVTCTRAPGEIGTLAQVLNHVAAILEEVIARLGEQIRQKDRLARILETTTDFVGTATPDGRPNFLNRAGRGMVGLSDEDPLDPLSIADFHPPWAYDLILRQGIPQAMASGVWSGETALLTRDGREIPISQVIIAHPDDAGGIGYLSTIMRDISRQKALERQLTASRDYYLKLFQEFPTPIWRAGANTRCNYFNAAWQAFTGRSLEQELGEGWVEGVHPDDLDHCVRTYLEAFHRRDSFAMEYRLRTAQGDYHWIADHGAPFATPDGEFAGYIGVCFDIQQRKESEERLRHHVHHDDLTGLPNSILFLDRLAQSLNRRAGDMTAVLSLDLDRFKTVNDSLGHALGNLFLQECARRLQSCLRTGDTLARWGGDEFAALLPEIRGEEEAVVIAQRLLRAFDRPFLLAEGEVTVSASLGLALSPRDGRNGEELLKNADAALFQAKAMGRDTLCVYTAQLHDQARARLSLDSELRHALEREEFLLHYQPQVDAYSGQIIGVEALVRWQHPERGLLAPGHFIHVAEETGLIVPMGEWVLAEACRQSRGWREAGLPKLRVAVNLSPRQFWQKNLQSRLLGLIQGEGVPFDTVELELTEGMLMRDPEAAVATLRALRDEGLQLAVDDFGIGYSSLNYLKRFPIQKLKVDQSFVRGVPLDPEDVIITRAVIELAHNLNMIVLAEGVETEAQRCFMRLHQCDEIQGFLYSRPLPGAEIAALLEQDAPFAGLAAMPPEEPRTLLLVDDEENILNTLSRLLRRDGYHLLRARSAQEALDLLACHRVGVILTDQRMPEMSGVEFLRRAKEILPEAVRIVLSGYTDLATITDAINDGAVYKFLIKPWDDEQLRANLRQAFKHHEMANQNRQLNRLLAEANTQLARLRQPLISSCREMEKELP